MFIKVQLINFRIFDKAKFTFDSDYCLVSGPSGSGKTTIFMAINFAITGEGKKLTKYGKKSCSVVLKIINNETDDITITRSKGPCRLIVKVNESSSSPYVLEDNEGQAEINRKLPRWELGYISQRLYKSFISMTPSDKLQFIEKLTFENVNIDLIQTKCKSLIAERKTQLTESIRQRKAIENVLENLGVIRRPIEEKEEYSKESLETMLLETNKLILKEQSLQMHKDIILQSIESVKQNIAKCDKPISFDCQENVHELVMQTNAYEKYICVATKLDKLTGIDKIDITDIDKKINDIKEILQLKKDLIDYKKYISIRDNLLDYKSKHAILITCPVCSTFLGLSADNNDVPIVIDATDTTISSISYKEAHECATKLLTYELKLKDMDNKYNRLNELKSSYQPETVVCFQKQLETLEQTKRDCIEYNKLLIQTETLKCEKPKRNVKDIVSILEHNERIKTTLDINEKKLASLITELNSLPPTTESKLADLKCNVESLKRRIQNVQLKDQYRQIDKFISIERDAELKLPIAVKLSSLIKTAEQTALTEMINRLNELIKIYIIAFFPLSDVSASLSLASGKINTDIFINNYEHDITSLSGGEFARIVLAVTLALAQIHFVPILLLDEILASLDAETSDIVMSAVKENYHGKVIVIAHQTTKGVFDNVIEL